MHYAELYLFFCTESDHSDGVQDVLAGLMKSGGKPQPVKGGIEVAPYLIYNCLADDGEAEFSCFMQKHWTCPQCGKQLIVTLAQRLQHEQQCIIGEHSDKKDEPRVVQDAKLDPLRKPYHCSICDKDYKFTTAEIFKHKKACSSQSGDK